MRRHLVIACLFAVVMGCADNEAKTPPPLQPTQGDSEESSDGTEPEGDRTLVPANEGEGSPEQSGSCGVSFTKDVMPKLVATCGSAACHQETTEPFVDDATPQITYESLRDFGFDDETWTDPHPADSKLDEPTLKAAIEAWRKCGAPFE